MRYLFFSLLVALMFSCNNADNANSTGSRTTSNADQSFQQIADDYLKGYLEWRPLSAVALGFHEYDGKSPDFSKASLDAELKRLKEFDQKLSAIDTAALSPKMFYDYRILLMSVHDEMFGFENSRYYYVNPMAYAGAIDVNAYIKRDFAPLEERVKYVIATEKRIPAMFVAAKENLQDSLPRTFVETAKAISEGSVSFLNGDLKLAVKEVKNDSLLKEFNTVNDSAIAATNRFIEWLQKEKMPKVNTAFAIGRDNYRKMLMNAEGISLTPEEILEIGLTELKREQDRFNAAAKIIDPNKKAIDVYHQIQKEHPTADNLIPEAKKNLELIRQFLIDKSIVTMTSEVRVQVKETPVYLRSLGTASMDVAGPFEKKATESYYYITPVDPKWTAKQKEDWLAMFDFYTTDNVTIHEAYPGHYTQFLHLNASDATTIEKIFGSYAFVEGWAHYTERMMIAEQNFGADGDSVRGAKFKLAQSGDALLRICRLCVSIKMHCQGMSLQDGTKFFMDNWYQGEKPAYQEALRGTFDPKYLFYTVGKMQLLKLRDDYQKQEGANFSLKKFHDLVLDNGMAPVRLLRERLLTDKSSWDKVL